MNSFSNLTKYIKKITNGPDFDDGIVPVAEFVLRCLSKKSNDHEKDIAALSRFIEICKIKNNQEWMRYPKSNSGRNPYLGLCATSSPLWAQAPIIHEVESVQKVYESLVAEVVSRSVLIFRGSQNIPDSYINSLASGYRSLRSLSEASAKEYLELINNSDYKNIDDACTDISMRLDESSYVKDMGSVRSMLSLLAGRRQLRLRVSDGHSTEHSTKWIHGNIDGYLKDHSETVTDDDIDYFNIKDPDGDEDDSIGFVMIPNEEDNEKNEDSEEELGDFELSKIINNKYKNLNIGKANQKFEFSWSVMTKAEQGWLIERLTATTFNSDVEGLLLLMLLTGKNLEQIIQARIVSKNDIPEYAVEFVMETYELRIKIKKPDIKPPKSKAFIKTESHIVLRLPLLAIEASDRSLIDNAFEKGMRLFKYDTYQADILIKSFLSKQPVGFRITVSKIKSLTAFLFANYAKDPAVGSLILDGVTALQKTVRHYLTVPSEQLRDDYELVLGRLGLVFSEREIIKSKNNLNSWVGTGYCLEISRLRYWICEVQRRLSVVPSSFPQLVRYHNLYVAYTIFMLSHCTLWRGNKSPIPFLMDMNSGFVVVDDKSIGAGYNKRANFLPPVMIDQINDYLIHIGKIKAAINAHLKKNVSQSSDWFILTESGKAKAIRVKFILNLSPPFPGRRNALRIHMRSLLYTRGVPGEMLDALMGHWTNGIEPYSCYSSLSADLIKRETQPFVIDIMNECGWRAVSSKILSSKNSGR